jgi:hypothetical protein
MIGILLSRSHGIMPPPRRFAGRSPQALRARAARPANIPASGQNGIYRKNDTQLENIGFAIPENTGVQRNHRIKHWLSPL